MRPVERGTSPGAFTAYKDARRPLIDRIGNYCSYCEVALKCTPHIEHVRPKSLHPSLKLAWSNFLLACSYCNGIKSDTDVVPENYVWPDQDNSFLAFLYENQQIPKLAGNLTATQKAAADRILSLVGLNRDPRHPAHSIGGDYRWILRNEAWGKAYLLLGYLQANDCEEVRQSIAFNALGDGFFSVWMAVFQSDSDMKRRFINAFQGTARDCFNDAGDPLPRPGGKI